MKDVDTTELAAARTMGDAPTEPELNPKVPRPGPLMQEIATDPEGQQRWAENAQRLLDHGEEPGDEDAHYGYFGDDGEDEHDDGEYEDEYDDGFLALVWDYRWWVCAACALIVFLIVLVSMLSGGGAGGPASSPDTPAQARAGQGAGQGGEGGLSEVAGEGAQETEVVIGDPVLKGDTYYLRAGQIAWKGRLEKTDTGDQLTLEGPTAVQFKRVTIPGGSITTGVFGRAEPGKPMLHATFHRTTIGGREETEGTYFAMDEDAVIAEGIYSDERVGDEITRTYLEHEPGSEHWYRYARTFESPPGVPIPVLVGWKPPSPVDKQAAG